VYTPGAVFNSPFAIGSGGEWVGERKRG